MLAVRIWRVIQVDGTRFLDLLLVVLDDWHRAGRIHRTKCRLLTSRRSGPRLIPPDDDGIVVVMSETEPRTVTREEFNRELVQALDDLVADARHHGELIKAGFEKTPYVARETPPPYESSSERLDRMDGRLDRMDGRLDSMDGRLDRIDRTLADIRDQMATKADLEEMRKTLATKIELEAVNDNVKRIADGYQTVNERLNRVAEMLKLRVVMP